MHFIFCCRFSSVIGYAYFGFSYFYYDLVVMFLGAYFKEQVRNPSVSARTVWNNFHRQKTLIIYHHLLLPIIALPLTVWSVSILIKLIHYEIIRLMDTK